MVKKGKKWDWLILGNYTGCPNEGFFVTLNLSANIVILKKDFMRIQSGKDTSIYLLHLGSNKALGKHIRSKNGHNSPDAVWCETECIFPTFSIVVE